MGRIDNIQKLVGWRQSRTPTGMQGRLSTYPTEEVSSSVLVSSIYKHRSAVFLKRSHRYGARIFMTFVASWLYGFVASGTGWNQSDCLWSHCPRLGVLFPLDLRDLVATFIITVPWFAAIGLPCTMEFLGIFRQNSLCFFKTPKVLTSTECSWQRD